MAARKKTARKHASANGGADVRAFTVVVEQMRSDVKVVAEAVMGVDARMMGLDARMTAGFHDVNRRFDGVDREIAVVKTDLSLVKTAVLETNREVKALRGAVDDLDARKADRGEPTSPPAG